MSKGKKKNNFTLTPRSTPQTFVGETMSHSCCQPRWCLNSRQRPPELTPAGLLPEQRRGSASPSLGLPAASGGSRAAAEQAGAGREGEACHQGRTSAVPVPGGLGAVCHRVIGSRRGVEKWKHSAQDIFSWSAAGKALKQGSFCPHPQVFSLTPRGGKS